MWVTNGADRMIRCFPIVLAVPITLCFAGVSLVLSVLVQVVEVLIRCAHAVVVPILARLLCRGCHRCYPSAIVSSYLLHLRPLPLPCHGSSSLLDIAVVFVMLVSVVPATIKQRWRVSGHENVDRPYDAKPSL